jgi:flagellin-like hook-associated protein FlgL
VVWLQATLPKLPVDNASTKSLLFATVDQELRIRAGSAGGVDMVVPGAKAKGDEVSVALKRDFVIKALKYGFTELCVNEPLDPVLFTAPGRQMIVMPVQTASASTATASQKTEPAHNNRINTPNPKPINERKITMSATTTPPPNGESKTGLQAAVEQVEQLRDQVRQINGGLGEALRTLKDAAKQQRTSEREVNTIRNRLRSLQSVEI